MHLFSKPTTQWLQASEVLVRVRCGNIAWLKQHPCDEYPYLSWRETVFGDITGLQGLYDVETSIRIPGCPPTYITDWIQKTWVWSNTGRLRCARRMAGNIPPVGLAFVDRQAMQWTRDNDWTWYTGTIWYLIQIERPEYTLGQGNRLYFRRSMDPYVHG